MTETRWLYALDGQARYYQDGVYIYSLDGKPEFWISDGWWYAIIGGQPDYYFTNGWVYSREGKPAYHYGAAPDPQ
jgi:hypothetical protein